jgi:acetyl-CoA/propionyl-CoA carboxylase biotin carboxyl carrier protein
MSARRPIEKVLIANRGEIALRILRTCRVLGIATVAVYSEVDADQRHVQEADESVCIGPAEARLSYLSVAAIVAAAQETGADAVHPGYGFLSEKAELAAACADAGIVFVGPTADVIAASADKLVVKRRAAEAGVPVIPGSLEPVSEDPAVLTAVAAEVGYPLILKASAGGGGKGMRRVNDPVDLLAAAEGARREAGGAFGNTELYVERIIEPARHVEVQVLADEHGTCLLYGTRDCSMQRRHQKVVEECPAPGVDEAGLHAASEKLVRALGYQNAGTIEFLVEEDGTFWFLELNRRLQVEHPVTEEVFGVDLVALQLRVAAGDSLADVVVPPAQGHAIEVRVYAEDPASGFLPSPGTVHVVREPEGPGIRVDSALYPGMQVSPYYDPMLAKVIAYGATREAAIERLDAALCETAVLGVRTNVGFLRTLLQDEDFRAARLSTGAIDARLSELLAAGPQLVTDVLLAAAADSLLPGAHRSGGRATGGAEAAPTPWGTLGGFRLSALPESGGRS